MPKLSPGPGLSSREVSTHQLARIREAMIGLVAENGYDQLTVRDLVGRAQVSTRTFYELFGSKEDCFIQTHQSVARCAARRALAAQLGKSDWGERLQLALEALIFELRQEPLYVSFTLIDTETASDAARKAARWADRIFEGMLAEVFSRKSSDVIVPPLILQGMVAGLFAASREHVSKAGVTVLANQCNQLVEWTMSYPHPVVVGLEKLDRRRPLDDATIDLDVRLSSVGDLAPVIDRRMLMLEALARLVVTAGYSKLSPRRVCSVARVSTKEFNTCFDSIEECYVTALELRIALVLAEVSRAQAVANDEAGAVYRGIATFIECLNRDRFLAWACLSHEAPRTEATNRLQRRLVEAIGPLRIEEEFNVNSHLGSALGATTGAVWALTQRYVLPAQSSRRQIAATLAYFALAPTVGASGTTRAIELEQLAPRRDAQDFLSESDGIMSYPGQ